MSQFGEPINDRKDHRFARGDKKATDKIKGNMRPRTTWYGKGLKIMLFGTNSEKKVALCNFIVKKKTSHRSSVIQKRVVVQGGWRGKPLTVVKTPDFLSLSLKRVIEEMKSCVSLCPPGPNVLLLMVKPSDFTEEKRKILKFILSFLGEDAFQHSMAIITDKEETNYSVTSLLRDCEGRHYNMIENNREQLMEKIENMQTVLKGKFLTVTEE
ncbi:GTPase IMAP family member 2-like, partial [Neolamprologus brichardi]|uniref:GTPase IMAP family member 2-like n=1 Tax=Neolamprologus brichardi TaxID=32507 RepID=UPI001643A7A2